MKIAWGRVDWTNALFLLFAHLVAVGGSALYLTLHGISGAAVGILLFWTLACGFSVTAGYHRLFAPLHSQEKSHAGLGLRFVISG